MYLKCNVKSIRTMSLVFGIVLVVKVCNVNHKQQLIMIVIVLNISIVLKIANKK